MKKMVIVFSVVFALVFVSGIMCLSMARAGEAGAEAEDGPRFGVGARVGFAMFSGGDYVDVRSDRWDYDIDEQFIYGINTTFVLSKYFSYELAVEYLPDTDMPTTLNGAALVSDMGELSSLPITFTVRFHIPTGTMVSPYIGGGVGYYFNDFDLDPLYIATYLNPGDSFEVEDSFGFHANAGTEIFFGQDRNFAMNVDVKYIWNQADLNKYFVAAPPESYDIDLDALVVGLGFKYYF
jgi:outer membrane protein